MTQYGARGLAAALATAFTLAACAGRGAAVDATPAPAAGASASATPAEVHAAAVARARADSVRRPWTAADAHFMTAMIHHHAQALHMAAMAPTHGASPTIQTLASRITAGQRDEIRTMQTWLRDRLQPAPEPHLPDDPAAPAAGGHAAAGHAAAAHDAHGGAHGGHDAAAMPGMLTDAQMRELDAARGREFDRLFLTYMIQHHRGAIAMVEELFASHGAGQDETIFRFASDVNVDQVTEIQRMERMLLGLIIEGSPE